MTTAWRWIHHRGFSYDSRKKSFYVDGHEREDVVAYRKEFCTAYLTEHEPLCLRWVQLPEEEKAIDKVNIEFGFCYDDSITNVQMIEFHEDYCRQIDGLRDRKAAMSVRAPTIFDQGHPILKFVEIFSYVNRSRTPT